MTRLRWVEMLGKSRIGALACLLVTGCGETSDELIDDGPEPTGVRGSLAAGDGGTCVLASDGVVRCWGSFAPDPVAGPSAVPELVGREWHAIDGSAYQVCALTTHGSVWCWFLGEKPGEVRGLHGRVDAISVGNLHACAVIRDGSLECWGSGNHGELGNGQLESTRCPFPFRGFPLASHRCVPATTRRTRSWNRVRCTPGAGSTTFWTRLQ